MMSEILFIQRFNLDTELGLYGARSSSEKKKRSPPQKSNNLIKDSLMSNILYLLPPREHLFEIFRRIDILEGLECFDP